MTQEFRVQTESTINYLDLLIIRHNHLLEADTHGKSRTTTSMIHFMSKNPIKHKLAAYRFLIHKNTKSPITSITTWNKHHNTQPTNGFPRKIILQLDSNIKQKQPK